MPLTEYKGSQCKVASLRELASFRCAADLSIYQHPYMQPEQLGFDFKEYVSPWTKAANNVDARVMLIAQDWSSTDRLSNVPEDERAEIRRHGQTPNLPTNRNIQEFLTKNFGLAFDQCFATNAFVFVKCGSMSSKIPSADLRRSVTDYVLPQINIVEPRLVLCLGAAVFSVIESVIRQEMPHAKKISWRDSLDNPLRFNDSLIVGLPHPGGRGTAASGGKSVVDRYWAAARQHAKYD